MAKAREAVHVNQAICEALAWTVFTSSFIHVGCSLASLRQSAKLHSCIVGLLYMESARTLFG